LRLLGQDCSSGATFEFFIIANRFVPSSSTDLITCFAVDFFRRPCRGRVFGIVGAASQKESRSQ
jgi:hypothetical protein